MIIISTKLFNTSVVYVHKAKSWNGNKFWTMAGISIVLFETDRLQSYDNDQWYFSIYVR